MTHDTTRAKCDCGQTPHKQLCVSNAVVASLSPTPNAAGTATPRAKIDHYEPYEAAIDIDGVKVAVLNLDDAPVLDFNNKIFSLARLIVDAVNQHPTIERQRAENTDLHNELVDAVNERESLKKEVSLMVTEAIERHKELAKTVNAYEGLKARLDKCQDVLAAISCGDQQPGHVSYLSKTRMAQIAREALKGGGK